MFGRSDQATFRRAGGSAIGAFVLVVAGLAMGPRTAPASEIVSVGSCSSSCTLPADTVSITITAEAAAGAYGSNATGNGGAYGDGEDITAEFPVSATSTVKPGDTITPYVLAGGSGGSGNEVGGGGGNGGNGEGIADVTAGQWLVVAGGGGGGGGGGGFTGNGGDGSNASTSLASACGLSIPPAGSNSGAGGNGGSAGTATDAGGGGGGGGGCPGGGGGSDGGIGGGGGHGGGAGGNFANTARGGSIFLAPGNNEESGYLLDYTEAGGTAPSITTNPQTTFTVGESGTFTVVAVGNPPPILVSEQGPLPPGVSFTNIGGGLATLAGTPAPGTGGLYPITITASNGVAPDAIQSFVLTVDQAPMISPVTPPAFTVGSSGSLDVSASGYPTPTLNISGTLPAGLSFTDHGDGTGVLSGTPEAGSGGTYPLTLSASNSSGSTTFGFTITVDEPANITSAADVTFTTGEAGSFQVTTTGHPTPTLIETGALPSGVTFADNGNGTATLAGTPSAGTGGTYKLVIEANNSSFRFIAPAALQIFVLTVDQAPAITSAANATFTTGVAGSFQVAASGFPTPALIETGALPAGLTFVDNGNGTATLAGTPAAGTGGTYQLNILATNNTSPLAVQPFTLTVDQAPSITSAAQTTFIVGQTGTFTVASSGYPPATLSESGALPAGLSFTPGANGTASVSGTPQAGTAGSYTITVTATNGVSPAATQNLTVIVEQVPLITSASSTTFTVGSPGSFTVTTTGHPTPALTEKGALPSGVTFVDNGNGTATLAGTPSAGAGGVYSFTISASNGVSSPAGQNFVLTVFEAPAFTSASSATAAAKASFTVKVTARGYPAPSLTETGKLPKGVTFANDGNGTGTLSGSTNSVGAFTFTITAANSIASTNQTFTLTITSH